MRKGEQAHAIIKRAVVDEDLVRTRRSSPVTGGPISAYVELLVVTDTTVLKNFIKLAGTSDLNVVFSDMRIYYANAINAVRNEFPYF